MTQPYHPEQIQGEPTTASFSVPGETPRARKSHYKGWLSKAFSMAATAGVGMGVGFAVKTCAISALCAAGAPAVTTAIVACAATGLVMGTGKALWHYHQDKKNGGAESFWSKKTGKTILFNTLVSSFAGSLAFTFSDQISDIASGLYDKASDWIGGPGVVTPDLPPEVVTTPPAELAPPPEVSAPPEAPLSEAEPPAIHPQPEPLEPPAPPADIVPPVQEIVPPAPQEDIPPPAGEATLPKSALDEFAALAADGQLSALAQQTLERAQAGNPQAIKDLGYFVFNGFQGLAENEELGVALFKQAADLGNVQAKVDLAYIAYHGLGGVDADPGAAYDAMKDLAANDGRARDFIRAWGNARPAILASAAPAP